MIIDSHIHLYSSTETSELAWLPLDEPDHPLAGQHSVDDFVAVTRGFNKVGPPRFRGFVFVETDRKHDLKTEDFKCPLHEVEWLARIEQGRPREGEGHSSEQKNLVLGIVAWAPLPLGADKLAWYIKRVKEAAGTSAEKIVGFRYLLQDKPFGTGLREEFIDSLKWLGRNGYVFDLGIDFTHESQQGQEALAMIRAAHNGVAVEKKVEFVINHICKPDLSKSYLTGHEIEDTKEYKLWRTTIWEFAKLDKTYIKLSGCLSQMVPMSLGQDLIFGERVVFEGKDRTPEELYELIEPWLSVVLSAFGAKRIMFGSDWPVCQASPSGEKAWGVWKGIVQAFCEHNKLSNEEQDRVWFRSAVEAYGLRIED